MVFKLMRVFFRHENGYYSLICLGEEIADGSPADPSEADFDPRKHDKEKLQQTGCALSLFGFLKEEFCFSSTLSWPHLVSLAAALKEIALV